jgi:hypothetical protein
MALADAADNVMQPLRHGCAIWQTCKTADHQPVETPAESPPTRKANDGRSQEENI